MKKSIIALAVAGAMTAPMIAQADATLYGSLRFDIDDADKADTDVSSNMARIRFGIKGSEETNAGLIAGYHVRLNGGNGAASEPVTTDRANVYLQGDFGRVTGGMQADPAEIAEDRVEYTLHSGTAVVLNPDDYTGGGLVYNTNSINGFKAWAGIGNVDNDGASSTQETSLSATYDSDLFGAAVSWAEGTDGKSSYAVSASTTLVGATIGARISDKEDTVDGFALGVSYPLGDWTLAANYESSEAEGADDSASATSISAAYALGGNATVTLGILEVNAEAEKAKGTGSGLAENDEITLRYQVDF
ncbi:MAG: porin [Pseudomonadales bacterium]